MAVKKEQSMIKQQRAMSHIYHLDKIYSSDYRRRGAQSTERFRSNHNMS